MLTELLYENASARPEDAGASSTATSASRTPTWSTGSSGWPRAWRRRGSAPATPWRCCCRTTRRSWRATSRSPASGAVVVPGQPRLQAGRARLLLPPVRRARGDQRRAHRRRLRADRRRLGAACAGDHHQLGARPGAHARRADGGGAGEARAALARRAARLPVLLGLHGPPEARGPHPRPVHAARRRTTRRSASGPRTGIFCAIPLFHTYGMGCCMFAAARTGATLVILEDPNPFLLRRQRALELLEQERCTIFPGVPFNFRLMAEAPRPPPTSPSVRLCLLRRHRAAAAVLRRLPRQVRGARPPALRLHRGGHADRQPGRRPGARPSSRSGTPVDGVEVRIEDEDGEQVPTGSIGEMAVRSPGLTSGYADMHELNSQVFRDGLLHHRRPRASSTTTAGSRSPAARSC